MNWVHEKQFVAGESKCCETDTTFVWKSIFLIKFTKVGNTDYSFLTFVNNSATTTLEKLSRRILIHFKFKGTVFEQRVKWGMN